MWQAVEAFSGCIDAILYIYFFSMCMIKKEAISARKLWITSFAFIGLKMLLYFHNFGYDRYLSVLLSYVYCRIIFEGKPHTYLLWIIMAIVINGVIDFFVLNVVMIFPDIAYQELYEPSFTRSISILSAKLILLGTYYVITLKLQKGAKIKWYVAALLACVPIGCWILLETLIQYSKAVAVPLSSVGLPILGSVGMLAILMASTVLYNILGQQELEFSNLKAKLRSTQLTNAHISELNTLYSRLAQVQHNLKDHFLVIGRYSRENNCEAISKYVDELNPSDDYIPICVGSPVLDALVSARASRARSKNIQFVTRIILPDKMPITDVDMSILFVDLLENAFEAIERLPGDQKCFIKLVTKSVEKYWVIICQNTADRKKLKSLANIPSSKKASELHGMGTRQIFEIAQKTGGYVSFDKENGVFTATVMLML